MRPPVAALEGLQAQRDLERQMSGTIPMSGRGFSMEFRGKWMNPPGWTGRWMLVREGGDIVVCAHAPPAYVAVPAGLDGNGQPKSRRAPPPRHLQRMRFAPKLVFVPDFKDYTIKRDEDGWLDAENEMPREYRQMLLECYGADPKCAAAGCQECRAEAGLTSFMRRLCAAEIAARDAKRRAPAPVATKAAPKTKAKRRVK